MYKLIITTTLLLTSLVTNASVILGNGDSYSSAFSLENMPDSFKLSDNFWDVTIGILDTDNDPSKAPTGNTSYVTLTLFENTDFTNQVFTETTDTRNWFADYGVFFGGQNSLFTDFDGSFIVTYTGPGQAEFFDIQIANFAGQLAPSNVASVIIYPTAAVVPLPAAVWLFGSGLIGLVGISRYKKNT